MGNFKQYLVENEEALDSINDILKDLTDDELDAFGGVLYYELFDNETDSDDVDEDDDFNLEDIKSMIAELGSSFYAEILDMLEEYEDEDEQGEEESDAMDEATGRRMKTTNMNRKKRKFMKNTKADLRKTKSSRKKSARANKSKRKRNYRANKVKIASYQKSRSSAIKKGKHKVKSRRNA
jgi:hypothetical protein